jgi:hypothetical protein
MERNMVRGTAWDRPAVLASDAGRRAQGGKPDPFGLKMIFNLPNGVAFYLIVTRDCGPGPGR